MDNFAEKRPFDVPIVVLDTETTGLIPEMGHRIIEIGAIRYENGEAIGKINHLLNPGRKIDPSASQVNGIADNDLVGQPTFADLAPDLLELLDGALILAHNARFDAGFLGIEFFIQSVQQRKPLFPLENPWLCTLQLARAYFRFGRNNLGYIANLLGVKTGQAHRALDDANTTYEIFKRMAKELSMRRILTIDDFFYAQGQPIFAPDHRNAFTFAETKNEIRIALERKLPLYIAYTSQNGASRRKITPLYPTIYKGNHYLIAYCHFSKDQRTFKVDRILRAEVASKS